MCPVHSGRREVTVQDPATHILCCAGHTGQRGGAPMGGSPCQPCKCCGFLAINPISLRNVQGQPLDRQSRTLLTPNRGDVLHPRHPGLCRGLQGNPEQWPLPSSEPLWQARPQDGAPCRVPSEGPSSPRQQAIWATADSGNPMLEVGPGHSHRRHQRWPLGHLGQTACPCAALVGSTAGCTHRGPRPGPASPAFAPSRWQCPRG